MHKNDQLDDVIHNKKEMKEWLKYELYHKYGKEDTIYGLFQDLFLVTEGAILRRHIILLRKTEYFINTNKKIRALIYKLLLRKFQNKYALNIPINRCGKGFKIMHLGPVLINEKAIIGKDCSLHMNTAVVAGGSNNGVPRLDDGVVVGIGAVVLGNIYIAKNVAIGANAVVNKSVTEENIAVAGVPARKISSNGRLVWKDRQ